MYKIDDGAVLGFSFEANSKIRRSI